MSGHSKWSTIKRKKGAADAKRGKIFTRCIHEITTAVKEGGGGDPDGNPRLRLAIDNARSYNMPGENIERAIRRATGEEKGEEKVEIYYEGYGPGGTAILVQVLTDNRNRAVGEVRHAFSRSGGALGESGCVNWMFTTKGIIAIEKTCVTEDKLFEVALEAGAEDILEEEDFWEVRCQPSLLTTVHNSILSLGKIEASEVQMIPSTRIELRGKEKAQMEKLIDSLEDLDDVVNVYTNCDFAEEE